jgi:ribonucleoside-diphosphate reductase alpha chain
MMAAAQPFLSGAISKTVNCAEETTIEEVENLFILSWKLGLKAVAIYRENSKLCAILSGKADKPKDSTPVKAPVDEEAAQPAPTRRRLPKRRKGLTQEATIGGHKLYLRTGEYADGKLGEIFIDMHKQGATMSAMLDSFAKLLSIAIQYGVPLEVLVEKFIHTKFEPRGIVHGDESIRLATSLLDYVFRSLGIEYLGRTDLSNRPPEAAEKHVALPTNGTHLTHTNGAKPKAFSNKSGETCGVCGDITVRSGTCSVCLNCGNNTGC